VAFWLILIIGAVAGLLAGVVALTVRGPSTDRSLVLAGAVGGGLAIAGVAIAISAWLGSALANWD
jgi:hypothetical protein